jgi:hypothetical protein
VESIDEHQYNEAVRPRGGWDEINTLIQKAKENNGNDVIYYWFGRRGLRERQTLISKRLFAIITSCL